MLATLKQRAIAEAQAQAQAQAAALAQAQAQAEAQAVMQSQQQQQRRHQHQYQRPHAAAPAASARGAPASTATAAAKARSQRNANFANELIPGAPPAGKQRGGAKKNGVMETMPMFAMQAAAAALSLGGTTTNASKASLTGPTAASSLSTSKTASRRV